ncbi:MAG: hypothetical protein K2G63_07115 [Oscillospiraceae bacterium]|nr:hypothetical protein [Oscillospiraceae bacterium]
MDKKDILRVKDMILNCADRLELIQALILCRAEVFTSGVYSERICLSDGLLVLVGEQLDSLVNDLRLLVESGFDCHTNFINELTDCIDF